MITTNPATGAFTLGAGYDPVDDRNWITVSDNDPVDGGSSGDTSTLTGHVYDGHGNEIAHGQVGAKTVGAFEAPDGAVITIHRINVDSKNMGYVTSEPLAPGTAYTYLADRGAKSPAQGNGIHTIYAQFETNSRDDDRGAPCFGPGTMIMTEDGEVPVEWLETGDKVLTRDHGFQPILWIGRTKIPPSYFWQFPDERPVRIPAGSLGPDYPTHDLQVTGDHRIMVRSTESELLFFSSEVLAPAKAWLDAGIATVVNPDRDYLITHVLCASHQIIVAQGAWVESMFAGEETLRRLKPSDVARLEGLLGPQLRRAQTARPCLTRREAGMLLSPLAQHHRIRLRKIA